MLENSTGYKSSQNINGIETSNLGPGCYVRVGDGKSSCWTEIVQLESGKFIGVVHSELSKCESCGPSGKALEFEKDNILELGCDNYCFC